MSRAKKLLGLLGKRWPDLSFRVVWDRRSDAPIFYAAPRVWVEQRRPVKAEDLRGFRVEGLEMVPPVSAFAELAKAIGPGLTEYQKQAREMVAAEGNSTNDEQEKRD